MVVQFVEISEVRDVSHNGFDISADAFRGFFRILFPATGNDDGGALFHKEARTGGEAHAAVASG